MGKYLPKVFVRTEQTRLMKHLLYGFFMFSPVRHSFASLIDIQLSRKATRMFQDVLFERFHRIIRNAFIFI